MIHSMSKYIDDFIYTLAGMVINFLSDSISTRVEGLKEGKSKVVENGHTLILGWNTRILPLVDQICQANISEGGMPIVVLADRDKPEMDAYWADALPVEDRHGSKIITRGGSRIENVALLKVGVQYARSIIALSEGDDPDEADAQTVRCILALTGGLATINKAPQCHIVLELQDVDNVQVKPGRFPKIEFVSVREKEIQSHEILKE